MINNAKVLIVSERSNLLFRSLLITLYPLIAISSYKSTYKNRLEISLGADIGRLFPINFDESLGLDVFTNHFLSKFHVRLILFLKSRLAARA